ncbi:MAG: right-handed parallel beta-helix repeat-containing protein, partial [Deltaproteobacteria bacterium]|nr:right-handed parallel beta-helix repeat-containing protein [Deltaproteobacteria bacterium]
MPHDAPLRDAHTLDALLLDAPIQDVHDDQATDLKRDAPTCPGLDPIDEPAAQLFVAPTGNDGAAGTMANPLNTLAEAATRFSTGGTIIVRGGVFPAQPFFNATGTASKRLVIRAAEGETPIFDGAGVTADWSAVIRLGKAQHVVVQGLEVRNCRASHCQGIDASVVLNLTIRDCHIHHMDGAGARFNGKTLRMEGNHLHDLALTNENNVDFPDGGWPTCMGTTPNRNTPSQPHTADVVIRNNRIEDCWGEGIGLFFASNALVEGNIVDNPFNVGIYLDNSFGVEVSRNFVRVVRGRHGGAGTAILMGSEPYDFWGLAAASTHDVEISNNVVVGGGGVAWWKSALTGTENTYARVSVQHNTIIASSEGALGFAATDIGLLAPSANVAQNNVLIEADASSLGNPAGWQL